MSRFDKFVDDFLERVEVAHIPDNQVRRIDGDEMSEKICRCGVDDHYCDYCYRRVVFERDQLRQIVKEAVEALTDMHWAREEVRKWTMPFDVRMMQEKRLMIDRALKILGRLP